MNRRTGLGQRIGEGAGAGKGDVGFDSIAERSDEVEEVELASGEPRDVIDEQHAPPSRFVRQRRAVRPAARSSPASSSSTAAPASIARDHVSEAVVATPARPSASATSGSWRS